MKSATLCNMMRNAKTIVARHSRIVSPVSLVIAAVLIQASPARAQVIDGGLPAVSPDGLRIAFVSNRTGRDNIYVVTLRDGSIKRVTRDSVDGFPWWGSAGGQIFYSLGRNPATLFRVDDDGSDARTVGRFPGRAPVPTPDASHVISTVGSYTDSYLLYSRIDGSDSSRLTADGVSAAHGVLSPDGEHVAFTRRDSAGAYQVWILDVRTKTTHPIPTDSAEGNAQWPAWSPDSFRIAFFIGKYAKADQNAHIWTFDLRSGALKKLAPHSAHYLDETPSWFPDGKTIAFQSNRTGRMEVWMMKADGTEPRQVTK